VGGVSNECGWLQGKIYLNTNIYHSGGSKGNACSKRDTLEESNDRIMNHRLTGQTRKYWLIFPRRNMKDYNPDKDEKFLNAHSNS
jgi:hypothetical protein